MRNLIVALALLTLVGCKNKQPQPAQPTQTQVAADERTPSILTPPTVPVAVAQAPLGARVVMVKADGSLLLAELPPGDALAELRGEPATAEEVTARVGPEAEDARHTRADGRLDPGYAKRQALQAAKDAGILGSSDFESCGELADVAGLRALTGEATEKCGRDVVLVLADVAAPASRVLALLAIPARAQLGVTVDGKTVDAAQALFTFEADASADADETEVTLSPGGAAQIAAAAAEARASKQVLRIRVDDATTAADLAAALAVAIDGDPLTLVFGEPTGG